MKNKKGFTLIELLIVIAIIGILSTIVLAALSDARNRGSDASVKSNLTSIRAQAEIYFDNNSTSYGTFTGATCPTTTSTGIFSVSGILNSIRGAVSAGTGSSYCIATGNAYAIAVSMKTAGQSWCVDNSGRSKQYAGTPSAAAAGAVCN